MSYQEGDVVRVKARGTPLSNRDLVIVASQQRGYIVQLKDEPSAGGYWFAARDLSAPAGAPPIKRSKASERARGDCPNCGYKRAACKCLELRLKQQLLAYGVELEETEFEFERTRKFRADFAWPSVMLLVEIEGGTGRSRHRMREGFSADLEKYNMATLAGWRILRYDTGMVTTGRAAREIAHTLGLRVD